MSGREPIDESHLVGALVSSAEIIGVPGVTPVRAIIDEAASMVPTTRFAPCVVTRPGSADLDAAAFGEPVAAWESVVETAAATHSRYRGAPVACVLSVLPERSADLWTGAKGFYKVEPVVVDGGGVVLRAPHIADLSVTHPGIAEIG